MPKFMDLFKEDPKKEEKPTKKTPKSKEKKKSKTTISKKSSVKNEKKDTKFDTKLRGDKSLSKSEIIEYIVNIIRGNKEKYTLDYLRAMKYNLDAINLAR